MFLTKNSPSCNNCYVDDGWSSAQDCPPIPCCPCFIGCKGPIGEQGPVGEQGPIGEQGPAGPLSSAYIDAIITSAFLLPQGNPIPFASYINAFDITLQVGGTQFLFNKTGYYLFNLSIDTVDISVLTARVTDSGGTTDTTFSLNFGGLKSLTAIIKIDEVASTLSLINDVGILATILSAYLSLVRIGDI